MLAILEVLLVFSLLATLAVLALGIYGTVSKKAAFKSKQNTLMRWRVFLQGLSLAIFALILILKG